MRNIINKIAIAAVAVLSLNSCIQEAHMQSGYATSDQVAAVPGIFDSYVESITASLTGEFTYAGNSSARPYDFGYPSFFLQRDVMGQDISAADASWYGAWYQIYYLGPTYAYSQLPWTYYYKWIRNCNQVLTLAGENPDASKVAGAGIAYAMRAMFYLDLARMFAPKTYTTDKTSHTVPIVTQNTTISESFKNPRATNEKMYAFILEDLDKAEEYLKDYVREDKFTPDLSVVYGLKARAYLTMGEWAKAEEYAKKAQNGYTAMTEAEYTSRTDGFNKPNKSWMFGLTYLPTDPNITLNDSDSNWGSQMIIEVVASECGYAANYGQPHRIDQHLYSTIPATDWRKKCYVDFAIDELADNASKVAALAAYSDVPAGILSTGANSDSKVVGGLEVKFRPKDGEHADQYAAFCVAVPLMRVEEMMLIEAEAAGRQEEARGIALLEAFAKTRDASYDYASSTHGNEAYYNNKTGKFVNEVWWQRRVELWGEGFATFDIKRLEKGIIRSYAGSNHLEDYRVNSETVPEWMNLCIVQTEGNYNSEVATDNNPTPSEPEGDSPAYVW